MNTTLPNSIVFFFRVILIITIAISFASCNHSRKQSNTQEETPQPLQDNKSSINLVSKRTMPDDLLQALYHDLVEKSPELKKLEENIKDLDESVEDSTATFEHYDAKNKNYYSAADNHLGMIKDSVLREQVKTLVSNSLKNYNSSITQHRKLLASLASKFITLNDLHEVVRITRTLPILQQYQVDNMPSLEPLEKFSLRMHAIIKKTKILSKANLAP